MREMATEATPKKDAVIPSVNTEQLSKDMETLKADIAQMAGTLRELGLQTRDTALSEGRRRYELARVKGHEQVDHLRTTAEDLSLQATNAVRERPAAALLIAAGIGLILGFLTARK
jgi:ElaB/YqjD/DUF883 family membrane-anchored ribosome-binding protein